MKKVIFTYDSKDMKHGQNGEIGEASASILVEDERAKEIRAAFNEDRADHTAYFIHAIADKVGKLLRLRDEQHIGGVLSAGIEFPALIAPTELDVVDRHP